MSKFFLGLLSRVSPGVGIDWIW